MTRRRKIILATGLVLTAAVALGALWLYRFADYAFESPQVASFLAPGRSRSAYLVWHGALMGRTLTFLVSPSNSQKDLCWIGSVDADDSLTFRELLWSREGNLVATRCYVGGYNAAIPGVKDNELLTHGYDFAASRRIAPARDAFDDPEGWLTRGRQLEQLLLGDGGESVVSSKDGLQAKMHKMTWLEWRTWRQLLETARKREGHT